ATEDELAQTALPAHTKGKNKKGELLIEKVKSPWPLDAFMQGVYTAESTQEAIHLLENLNYDESVITREGLWFNRLWLKILKESDPDAGVFQREKELKEIAARLSHLQETENELEKHIARKRQQIQELENEREQLQQSFSLAQAHAAQTKAQYK